MLDDPAARFKPYCAVPFKVGRCRLAVSQPVWKARMVSALKLQYDETLLNFAFNFNLSGYIEGGPLEKFFREGGEMSGNWSGGAGSQYQNPC